MIKYAEEKFGECKRLLLFYYYHLEGHKAVWESDKGIN